MNEPKCNDGSNYVTKKRDDAARHKSSNSEFVAKPTLYSSIIQTESKLRNISLSRSKSKPITNKAGIREVNFPLTEHVYNYESLVDVGLHSGSKSATKLKTKEVHITKNPEPKLSDYYQPSFDNAQRIQMNSITTTPELTVQYDGLAVSRLLNEIDDIVFNS